MAHDTPPAGGLTEVEARARLARLGPNRLPPPAHRTAVAALRVVMVQPMVLLLLACMALYGLLGNLGDAAMLFLSVLVVAAISVYQELRTQRVLEALYQLASPRSTVIRDGVARRISSQDLVEGDRIVVQEGDRLACDARLLSSHGMRVDESMLTGESSPVDKVQPGAPLHAGTLAVQGDGEAVVTATGVRTALGRVGGTVAALGDRRSRLNEQIGHLVRVVAALALATCLVVAGLFAWRESSLISGLLVGLTLAMSIVPEEFAVVWAVMLALGAWRLSRLNVLTRRPQAIEALGTASVLCVDKTGTLTENHMVVAGLHDGVVAWRRPGTMSDGHAKLLGAAADASIRDGIEPMDRAILELQGGDAGTGALLQREGVQAGRPFVRQVWQRGEGRVVAMKGAPEAVLACCVTAPDRVRTLQAQADAWASEGLRVLAVACADAPAHGEVPETGYQAIGLVAFEDPLRQDVPGAIRACAEAGVRVVMITGDAPATAWAIAAQAGIVEGAKMDHRCLSGAALEAVDARVFRETVNRVRVFARVSPAQKLRIVQGLQAHGEVVAMTGDGVNDGPALRAADIGVAMGQRGTDVAREAAALVLLDDRFGSLVDAVRGGRRIFANLQKAVGYLFAVHVPIVGVSLLPVLGGPVLLWPVHVVLLELIIDPACSLVFEAEPAAADTMRRGPRASDTPLFSRRDVARALAVGSMSLLFTVAGQLLAGTLGADDSTLRLTAFLTIVAGNLLMVRWFRRRGPGVVSPNRIHNVLVVLVCVAMVPLLSVPLLGAALGFPPDLGAGWVAVGAALLVAWPAWCLARDWHPRGGAARPLGQVSEEP